MHVIGTAGHVDHGKSTLVRTLTGINPDRLREEQEREMTIDLGFAWLTLPDGESVSIVDVPGHEDFVRNMLAGVGGIDVALIVIAADEGVMPQTREHIAILNLLRVNSGVVALTKSDLVQDEEWLELVVQDVRDLLAPTTLAEAEIIPVSSRTGQGIAELIARLGSLIGRLPAPADLGRPRLPIDRVFTVAGFGTVVTGTLIEGRLAVGDEVIALPDGLKGRIRGLQSHKARIEKAAPGARLAVNVNGIRTEELQRGDVVTHPGCFSPTWMADARLDVVADVPAPLRHNMEAEFFSGSARIPARVRILGVQELEPGQSAWVQLCFAEAATLAKNDRFILRQFSPSRTLGGGVVVEAHPQRRHRRFHPETLRHLETQASGSPEDILLQTIQKREPVEISILAESSGLTKTGAGEALQRLLSSGRVFVVGRSSSHVMSVDGWQSLLERAIKLVKDYHRRFPLRPGMPREELKSRLRLDPRAFDEVVSQASSAKHIIEADSLLHLPDHSIRLSASEQAQFDQLVDAFHKNRFSPPTVREAKALVGPELFAVFLDREKLVKVSEDFYYLKDAYDEIVERIVAEIRSRGLLTVGDVRDIFGVTRKYILPLLDHLDSRRITKRVGDDRVLG
jgi:selenocysteine-specific elongation factor